MRIIGGKKRLLNLISQKRVFLNHQTEKIEVL